MGYGYIHRPAFCSNGLIGYWVFSSLGDLTLGSLSVLFSIFIVWKLSNISVSIWEIITAFISFPCWIMGVDVGLLYFVLPFPPSFFH
jgi:hypothetical protein